jgi:hypothetical protein
MPTGDADETIRRLDAGIARLRQQIPAHRPKPNPAELADMTCPSCAEPLVAGSLRVPHWYVWVPPITYLLYPRGKFDDAATGQRTTVPILGDGPAYRRPSCQLLVIPNA